MTDDEWAAMKASEPDGGGGPNSKYFGGAKKQDFRLFGTDLFGDEIKPDVKGALREKFEFPPFSVLNAREGAWQARKRAWLSVGIQSELGRGATPETRPNDSNLLPEGSKGLSAGLANNAGRPRQLISNDMEGDSKHRYDAAPGGSARPAMDYSNKERGDGASLGDGLAFSTTDPYRKPGEDAEGAGASGTSIFDPVLTELSYRWFCPEGGLILDPFAGGSVRGLVAGLLGFRYHGIDLRPEQVAANEVQRTEIAPEADITWHVGDSNRLLKDAPEADFVFSCPPYGDLEQYSDDPNDLSTMTWEQFNDLYALIIKQAVARLKPNRFASFVVGEYRDKKTGMYRGFVPATIAAFEAAGAQFYNEAILITAVGSLPIRITKQFEASRKLGKTHQNVLVFCKGDPKLACEAMRRAAGDEPAVVAKTSSVAARTPSKPQAPRGAPAAAAPPLAPKPSALAFALGRRAQAETAPIVAPEPVPVVSTSLAPPTASEPKAPSLSAADVVPDAEGVRIWLASRGYKVVCAGDAFEVVDPDSWEPGDFAWFCDLDADVVRDAAGDAADVTPPPVDGGGGEVASPAVHAPESAPPSISPGCLCTDEQAKTCSYRKNCGHVEQSSTFLADSRMTMEAATVRADAELSYLTNRPGSLLDELPTQTLAQFLGSEPPRIDASYRPDEPPDLTGIDTLEFDTETDGLCWWEKDRPIGLSCRRPDGSTFYLPWGHSGGNLDEAAVKRWCERELRGKHLVGAGIKFDVNMMKSWGIDLEEQGCTVSDVQIYAALLDDSRKKFNLDILSKDFLGKEKTGRELDKTRMQSYHASEVAEYAKTDVALTGELRVAMMPLLDAEDLQRVRQLEDDVIYPVCHMERNGAPLDMELLERWVKESETVYNATLLALAKEVGRSINPDAASDLEKLFDHLHLPITRLPSGAPSFTDAILKRIDHPLVKRARFATKLSDLRSRYLLKYQKAVSSDGILRYAMHQTRYQKDDGREGGVGPGRFSSSELADGVGCNIQQVYKLSKQRKAFGYPPDDETHDDEIHLIRKLMVPREGQWLSADLMQVEFRLFSHYAGNQTLLQAYRDDPLMSFHDKAVEMVRPHYPEVIYDEQKNWTFAYLYGAKTIKQAVMMDFITEEEGQIIRAAKDWNSPKLARTVKIASAFNGAIPEAERLMKKCAKLAEDRGWIKTLRGRRSRFAKDGAFHKSMNNLLQGGSADYMKEKLVEIHRERKNTGFLLRISVHDELDGDARESDTLAKVQAILNRQSWPELKVPLLWDIGLGRDWASAKS